MAKSLRKYTVPLPLLELVACELAFACFTVPEFYDGVSFSRAALASGITALAFWAGFQWGTQVGMNVLQPAFVGAGMALLVESLMVYTEVGDPLSLLALVGGCLGATLLAIALRKWITPQLTEGKILLLGCGAIGSTLATRPGSQLAGVLDGDPRKVPPGAAYLGGFPALEGVIAARQPVGMVLDLPYWENHISPRFLLERKLEGRQIETAATVYKRVFQRKSIADYQPFHFWQETLRSNRRVMAFQSIYSNLSGLILLVGLSPVLVLLGLATRLAAGPGPVFESVLCTGFQRIPFSRRRFRIHRFSTRQKTALGKLISALHLTNLPQVINLVRGEMGLFGPQPMRAEFATYLEDLSPIYSYRLSMKPGIFGWAQANANPQDFIQEESVRIEYDLYYLESGSPFVDFEILLRTLARSITAWKR